MALIRWSSENDWFNEMERAQRDMSRWLNLFNPLLFSSSRVGNRASVYPALNIYDDGESLIVRAEVPGVDPKSLDVNLTGDTLTLRGERKPIEIPETGSFHRRERDFGQFCRSITLPSKVNSDKVMAGCKDGILEVRLPHAEETKARKISINVK